MKFKKPDNTEGKIHLERVEASIAKLVSNQNRDRENHISKNIANTDRSCNTVGMWKQIKKLFSKVLKNVPIGVPLVFQAGTAENVVLS